MSIISQGKLDEANAYLEKAKESITSRSDVPLYNGINLNEHRLIIIGINQATILSKKGRFEEAIEMLKDTEIICRRLGEMRSLINLLSNKARDLMDLNRYEEAFEAIIEGEELSRELMMDSNLIIILETKADLLDRKENFEESVNVRDELIILYKKNNKREAMVQNLNKQAKYFLDIEEYNYAIAKFELAEQFAVELENNEWLPRTLNNKAAALIETGRILEAQSLCEKAKRHCNKTTQAWDFYHILRNQAIIALKQERWSQSLEILKEQEILCNSLNNNEFYADTLNLQITVLKKLDQFKEALSKLEKLEPILKELNNSNGLQNNLSDQADIYWHKLLDHDKAISLYQNVEKICRENKLTNKLQKCLGNLAVLLMGKGEDELSMNLLQEQEEICRTLENMSGLQLSLGNQGALYVKHGYYDSGMEKLEEQEKICLQINDLKGLQGALLNQGIIQRSRKKLQKAYDKFTRALNICEQIKFYHGQIICLINISQLFIENDDLKPVAIKMANQACILTTKHGLTELKKQAEDNLERLLAK
ncbi:MAG: hypothetical protein KDE26_06730 [Bacteroidetes bacterium]|nr:hypothetical protein [Bacteroidota bacterium]